MNSRQVDAILDLSETLSFTKTSRNLFLWQPTLTYQIHAVENELGFPLFVRNKAGVDLTPAGKAFVKSLRRLRSEYQTALEEAQNYSENYTDDIVLSLPYRSAIFLLPQAMILMEKVSPTTLITPRFGWRNRLEEFLSGRIDKDIRDLKAYPFYESRIYLVVNKEDVLAKRASVGPEDLLGRKLMVGGGSQKSLKKVQKRMIEEYHIAHFNSDDHDTTLTNIAANKGIVLAPGYLHDRNDGFCWIPFECEERIQCGLFVKESNRKKTIPTFIAILKEVYAKANIQDL